MFSLPSVGPVSGSFALRADQRGVTEWLLRKTEKWRGYDVISEYGAK
jgi:hypothetical protein